MWAWESWPPEIDIFEGYSNKRGSYFNWSHDMLLGKFWRTKTNFWLKDNNDKHYDLGAKAHYWTWKNPKSNFNHYMLDWRPDRVDIFFNHKMVRSVRDKETLNIINKTTQNVIINNMVQNEHNEENPSYSEFIVNYFKYTPLK